MAFRGFSLSKSPAPKRPPDAAFGEDSSDDEQPAQQGSAGPTSSQTAAELQEAGDRAAAAGQWGLAIQRWDAALAASPADPHKLHEAKAQASGMERRATGVWLEVGEDWKAVQAAQRAVALRPDWPEGHLTLSRAQLNMGEPELALQSMDTVLRLCPGHAEAEAEVVAIRTLVLQRRAGGAAGRQRAQVVPGGGSGGGGG